MVVIGANNNVINGNGVSAGATTTKSTICIKEEDNAPDLDEMFRIAISQAAKTNGSNGGPNRGPAGTPMRQRNLPASFFQPPDTGSRSNTHSRESSFDQCGSANNATGNIPGGPFSPMNPASPAMSCPMSPGLMANLSIQGSPAPMSSTSSSSLSNNSTLSNGSNSNHPVPAASPLPPMAQAHLGSSGGGNSNNGSNSRINIVTTNNGPVTISAAAPALMSIHSRAHSSPAQLTAFSVAPASLVVGPAAHGGSISGIPTLHSRQLSYDIDKMKLPDGWEMSVCKNTGKRYFIDHANKTTTWDDPRMAVIREQMEKTHQNQLAVQRQQQQLARLSMSSGMGSSGGLNGSGGSLGHGPGGGSQHSIGHGSGGSNPNLGPLPDGWEERLTPTGEAYFVNHLDKTTQWQDPRAVRFDASAINRAPPPGIAAVFGPNSASAHLANLRIQQLQHEREAMRVRREQLAANSLRSQVMEESVLPTTGHGNILGGILGVDPFLGSDQNHSRQESSDSGLGLGSNLVHQQQRSSNGNLLNDTSNNNSFSGTGHHQRQASFGNNNNNNNNSDNNNDQNNLMRHVANVGGGGLVDKMESNDLGLDPMVSINSMEFGSGIEQMEEDFMALPEELADIEDFLSSEGGLLQ